MTVTVPNPIINSTGTVSIPTLIVDALESHDIGIMATELATGLLDPSAVPQYRGASGQNILPILRGGAMVESW
jgi:hypothetical protein